MEVHVNKCNNCPFKAENYNDFAIGNDTVVTCNLKAYLGLKSTYLTSYGAEGSCEHCNAAMDDSLETGEDFENYFDKDLCTCGETPDIPIPDYCPIRNVDIKITTNDK